MIRPCDVVHIDRLEAPLLVVETNLGRLQAGTIIVRDEVEVVTLPGTYFPKDLGTVTRIDEWDPCRAATALTLAMFAFGTTSHDKYIQIWTRSLQDALLTNHAYLP